MFREKIENIVAEFESVEEEMAKPSSLCSPSILKVLGKKLSARRVVCDLGKEYLRRLKEEEELMEMMNDPDPEMRAMAKGEFDKCAQRRKDLEEEITVALVQKDPNDEKDVIVEIRPAAGGEEASLFASEYARAIFRYAENAGYKTEVLTKSETGSGGIKELIAAVRGEKAFSLLKFESGVHRVQRVPETESQGRIHTSTITVAVLPEVEEMEFEINLAEVRIDVFRSSGPGGQSVNTTDSAVRLTHLPTGVTVSCQDEKSQLKNKHKAFQVLRARLYAIEEEKRMKDQGEKRLAQIGTGERSEKIRTYNFPQDRVTDHRIQQNFSNIPSIMEGGFGSIIDALRMEEYSERLRESGLQSQKEK